MSVCNTVTYVANKSELRPRVCTATTLLAKRYTIHIMRFNLGNEAEFRKQEKSSHKALFMYDFEVKVMAKG